MQIIIITALISLLLLAGDSETKESKNNDIPSTTKDKVDFRFGIKVSNATASYTRNLQITGRQSLFDAMRMLEIEKDGTFRFNYTLHTLGAAKDQAYITSINGLAEDKSIYYFWMLYNCKDIINPAHLNDLNGCIRSGTGVSQTFPENGDYFIFIYQYYNWKESQH